MNAKRIVSMSLPLGLALSLGLTGCRKDGGAPAAAGEGAGAAAAASATDPTSPANPARRLALLPPAGDRPVDQLITQLQALAQKTPRKVDAWVVLGRAWVRKARETTEPGFYLNADACAEVALRLDPDSAVAMDLRGLVLLNDHRFAEARDLARAAIGKNGHDPMAYGSLSDALLELGDTEGAVAAAERMMELKPSLPSYTRASYLAWLRGDAVTAKEAIRQAIDASPSGKRDPEPRAFAVTQAALLFWHQGDYDGADAGFQLALSSFPDYPPALVGRARVLLARGKGAEAAELLSRAYDLSPLPETAWLLGDARGLAGDGARQQAAYDLVERSGRRADPRTLALFYATLDRKHDEALALLSEERKKRGDTYTRDAWAFALYRAGRLPEARAEIDGALKVGVRDAKLLFHGGAIHLATGDGEGGRRLLREALQLNPHFDVHGAAEARRLLGAEAPQLAARR